MKLALIIAGLALFLFLVNSCSCPLWFNNGCEWSETWLGGGHQ